MLPEIHSPFSFLQFMHRSWERVDSSDILSDFVSCCVHISGGILCVWIFRLPEWDCVGVRQPVGGVVQSGGGCDSHGAGIVFMTQNIFYNVTEHELQTWMMQQYMMKLPIRQFSNNMNVGFSHNLTESVYAFLGI